MIDYIIVGFGIAGASITAHLEREVKSVFVIDKNTDKASEVAAGIYNPVVLKRFTLAWQAEEQLNYAINFYEELGAKLKISINEELAVLRKFNSAEEQNKWFSKIDQPELAKYLSPYLVTNSTDAIEAPFKYGQVMHTGRILIKKLLKEYSEILLKKQNYKVEDFDFSKFNIADNYVEYKGVQAKRIIFCEGYQLKNNPFFKDLPLIGNKGSYLIIKCEKLRLKQALKSHFFLVPLGNDMYKFGATYEHHIKTDNYKEESRKQLIEKLNELINVPYKIMDQISGIRPTVKDRRPLVGQHKIYENLYLLNGMGTRGVMIAPTASKHLVNFLEKNVSLPKEIDCSRFY